MSPRWTIRHLPILLLSHMLLQSCSTEFDVEAFEVLDGMTADAQGVRVIELDSKDAYKRGFIIPAEGQTEDGMLHFSFMIRNNTNKERRYYYKIYYQNETYKFPESSMEDPAIQHPLAHENFYGSWEVADTGFVATPAIPADDGFHEVRDKFRIVGDPRQEIRYRARKAVPPQAVDAMVERIKGQSDWLEEVRLKAEKNQRPLDEQLRADAHYVLEQNAPLEEHSHPGKRNPRVGEYGFLLVVTTEENITRKKIPDEVRYIGLPGTDHPFTHPYHYFLHGAGSDLDQVKAVRSDDVLKVVYRPALGGGIYVSEQLLKTPAERACINANCGPHEHLVVQADLEQFTHHIDPSFTLKNVPVVADVHGGAYGVDDHAAQQFSDEEMIVTPPFNTSCPCRTVISDPINDMVILRNPGTVEGEWRKENVGVITRSGLTYGKYRVKAKLPELVNESGLWNGLTNAIWLITQSNEEWNHRRPSVTGYLPKERDDQVRATSVGYSEIDIEIVKAARYWPATSYPPGMKVPDGSAMDPGDIMVTATNWDLADPDVARFTVGVDSIEYKGRYYDLHRWDHYYKALTAKSPAPDDELFKSDHYYFEIEWRPTEIIWRMGPEPDRMKIFAYMDATVSNIPNNQMQLVITQEFHHTDWWPEAPFAQHRIPFPANDIEGRILEIIVE